MSVLFSYQILSNSKLLGILWNEKKLKMIYHYFWWNCSTRCLCSLWRAHNSCLRMSELEARDANFTHRVSLCENWVKNTVCKSYVPVVFSTACWHWWGPVHGPRRQVDPPAGPVSGLGFHNCVQAGLLCWPQRAGGLWPGWCSPDPASTPWSRLTSCGLLGWALASPGLGTGPPGWTDGKRNTVGNGETEVRLLML